MCVVSCKYYGLFISQTMTTFHKPITSTIRSGFFLLLQSFNVYFNNNNLGPFSKTENEIEWLFLSPLSFLPSPLPWGSHSVASFSCPTVTAVLWSNIDILHRTATPAVYLQIWVLQEAQRIKEICGQKIDLKSQKPIHVLKPLWAFQ